MAGTVWGLGVGPGDPELITVKALRLMQAAPVVAYPAPLGGESFARGIVRQWLDHGQQEIVIEVPMETAPEPAQAAYDRAADRIGRELDAGRDVAVLCQGDPFFYGSFMYLFGRLAARFKVEIVPGVSSLTASAAALQAPLAARNDVLAVLPGPLPEEELARRLGRCRCCGDHQARPAFRQAAAGARPARPGRTRRIMSSVRRWAISVSCRWPRSIPPRCRISR